LRLRFDACTLRRFLAAASIIRRIPLIRNVRTGSNVTTNERTSSVNNVFGHDSRTSLMLLLVLPWPTHCSAWCIDVGRRHNVSNLSSVRSWLGVLQSAAVWLAERQLPPRVHQSIVLLLQDLLRQRRHHRRCPYQRRRPVDGHQRRQTIETMQTSGFAN